MSERRYAFGYQGQRLTKAEMEQRAQWNGLHPELRRRLLALFDAAQDAGTDLGIGGGMRSSAQQQALFLSRYDSVPYPTTIRWDGRWWKKKPNVAAAAPPNRSYHEPTVGNFALAADLVGDLSWMKSVCDKFGLLEFSNVNREPWHVQPVEVPKSRSLFRGQQLKVWPLPAGPVVRPVRAVLKAPVKHSDVAVLQRALNALSGTKLTVDGLMSSGGQTEVALKSWQRFFGMTVDGVCGPKTWDSIYNVASMRGYKVV